MVERWGGHVAKYMSDGVLAYFGWPQAHEDAAERAVRAGLDVVKAVSALEAPGLALSGGRDERQRLAVRRKAGRIIAAGMTKEVTFKPVDGPIKDLVDDAYRAKYHGSPYLSPMISARARSSMIRVTPRDTDARSSSAADAPFRGGHPREEPSSKRYGGRNAETQTWTKRP